MIIKAEVKKGVYYDSVSLMQAARAASAVEEVAECSAVMGTRENKNILNLSGMLAPEAAAASDEDLLIVVKANNLDAASKALETVNSTLGKNKESDENVSGKRAFGLDNALKFLPNVNIAVVSVAGKYAGKLTEKCLDRNINVFLFSDNVSLKTEIMLKKKAEEKGLFLMGPDCGTSIINGVPLGFANVVRRGNIGIISAAGTGLQEVSTIISNEGAGISQAVGTGSRDIKKEVGGVTFLAGLSALKADNATEVVLLVSKPPDWPVMQKILKEAEGNKPVVAVFLGSDSRKYGGNIIYARTLEEGALKAAYLSMDGSDHKAKERIFDINTQVEKAAVAEARRKSKSHKYIRALYSGGTYAAEAQVIFSDLGIKTYSNVPLKKGNKLRSSLKLKENSVLDLGEDEFTVGRMHPMIDYSLRSKMIIEQAKDKSVSVILLDVVLGYGANMNPLTDLVPAIRESFKNNKGLSIVVSVCGTESDPQNRNRVTTGLRKEGVLVMPSNASATKLAAEILRYTFKKHRGKKHGRRLVVAGQRK